MERPPPGILIHSSDINLYGTVYRPRGAAAGMAALR